MAKKVIEKNKLDAVVNSNTTAPKPSGIMSGFSDKALLIFFLGFIALAVYANTLRNGFVYDDVTVITENNLVKKGLSAIPEILTTPYHHGYQATANDLYRPLSLVVFAAEYQLFGADPLPFHLLNILLFAGCVIVLFRFLDKLFEGRMTIVAIIAALLFALHPVHTEVVANIKSGDELLCFFFALLSLNIFIRYIQAGSAKDLAAGLFCFLLAMFSKETAITFLALIPLIFFFYRNENKKRSIHITAGVFGIAIIFLFIRAYVLQAYDANHAEHISFIDNFLVDPPSVAEKFATEIKIMGYYLKLLFVPYPLISDYSVTLIPFVGFANIWVITSLLVYCLLLGFSILGLVKKSRDPYVFAVSFFLITIALFSNILLLIGTAMAERLLFFPSVGFCLLIALFVEKWMGARELPLLQRAKNPRLLAVVIPLALIYIFVTVNRNSDWQSDSTLFSADIKQDPDNSRINNNLGTILLGSARKEKDPLVRNQMTLESAEYFRKALAVFAGQPNANYNLALACKSLGVYDSAIIYFKRGLALKMDKESVFLLAQCYYKIKAYDSSIIYCYEAMALDPDNTDAKVGLGNNYLLKQNYDSAAYYFETVIRLKPDNTDALNNLGIIYYAAKKYDQAIAVFKKVIAIQPNNIAVYNSLGSALFNTGAYEPAIGYLKKAYSLFPEKFKKDIPEIAISYQKIGNMDSARKYEVLAQKDDPGFKL